MRTLLGILILFVGLQVHARAQDGTLEQLTEYMIGDFNSSAQAERDTSYFNISLKMARVWKNQTDVWLYLEQAVANDQDHPYRQRMYRLEDVGNRHFLSHIYELPNAERYVGGTDKPKLLKQLNPEELTQLDGCSITLLYDAKNQRYFGNTAEFCANNWKGAYAAYSEVEITEKKLISWDRGFDADGNQIWGAIKGGYEFIKE